MKTNHITIELTEYQHKELNRLIPWGFKQRFFSKIINDVIHMIQLHGKKSVFNISSGIDHITLAERKI